MRSKVYLILFLASLSASQLRAQTSCDQYNWAPTPIDWSSAIQNGNPGTTGHTTGAHTAAGTLSPSCSYSPNPNNNVCYPLCTAEGANGYYFETGTLTNPLYVHDGAIGFSPGTASSNGPSVSCQVTVAAAVLSCLMSCQVVVSFNATASGIGTTVNFPPGNILPVSYPDSVTCAPENSKSGGCGGGMGGSPILIDTTGQGYPLTSAQDGVMFDIEGNGTEVHLAWTAKESKVAFLALDRNGNGRIDDGTELFGNYTPQQASPPAQRNGYAALFEFDKPQNGGNGDGIIDSHDAVWSKLRLWIDSNHDGVSQPEELFTLPELGVNSLGLTYDFDQHTDAFGNQFRYKGTVNPLGAPDHINRTDYDVFFVILGMKQKQVC